MEPIQVGLVGCGPIAQLVHLPNLLSLAGCEVVAIADLRVGLARQVAQKHDIPKVYASHSELAADPDITAVVAITHEAFHGSIATDLVNAGKHVMIEKPLTTNAVDGEVMVEAADRSGVVLMVNFMRRYDPGVDIAKHAIDELRKSSEIGELTFLHCHRFGSDWGCDMDRAIGSAEPYPDLPQEYPAWVPESERDRFRAFNSAYCHELDLLRFIVGGVPEVEYARIGASTLVVLDFNGVPATIEAGSSPAPFWDQQIKVYFSRGSVTIKLSPPLLRNVPAEVEVFAAESCVVRRLKSSWEWSFHAAARHFLACVQGNEESRSSAKDALKTQRLIETVFAKSLERAGDR